MPPKQKITSEMLLSHAFQIAREQGISAVTSRSVAKTVGGSIQPVFSHFPTMEALRKATFVYASETCMAEILKHQDEPDFMLRTNIWLLELARSDSNLFELLYLSGNFSSPNLWDTMMEWESNQKMIELFSQTYQLTAAETKDIFMRSFFMLFGIATMIATDKIDISNDEALDMVKRTVAQLVGGKGNG